MKVSFEKLNSVVKANWRDMNGPLADTYISLVSESHGIPVKVLVKEIARRKAWAASQNRSKLASKEERTENGCCDALRDARREYDVHGWNELRLEDGLNVRRG